MKPLTSRQNVEFATSTKYHTPMLQIENSLLVNSTASHLIGQDWPRRRRREWIAYQIPENIRRTLDGQFVDPYAWMTQVVVYFNEEQPTNSTTALANFSSEEKIATPVSKRDIELPRGTPKVSEVTTMEDPPSGYCDVKTESRVSSPQKAIATPSILNDSTHFEPETTHLPSKRLDFDSLDINLNQLTEHNTEINRSSSVAAVDNATDEVTSSSELERNSRKRKATDINSSKENETPGKKTEVEQKLVEGSSRSRVDSVTNDDNESAYDVNEKENNPENVSSSKSKIHLKKRVKRSIVDGIVKQSQVANLQNGLRRSRRRRIPALEYWRNERPLYGRRESCQFPTYVAYVYRRPDNKFVEKRLFSPATPAKELTTLN
jgi:hypothetical protein